ncbi:uncharacterized protein VICG_00202 [Vittaforma corneae ATCC 50505]|uniref:Adenylate kinase n=1 Tax=Vittaforma corneae (strain ATCC 50505) TaxID=993615 RepID=L2GRD1_VITCO|nr:uncharacterized protein VICG_00202 [Vittaforma corneae ATCC 50505]ELA42887.1 hypothetical protein VICG_00202 [Vittaforma corneae ATCC 50505]
MSTTCCTTQKLNLIVIGLPGCGKGTQSAKIAKHYNLKHVTSGDLLRQEVERNSKYAKQIQELMKTGKLFPDDLVNSILLEHVPKENYILDGYPRKLSQVKTFEDIDLVIYIELPEQEAVRRILHRNQGRSDDSEEAVKVRLRAFDRETEPVIEYYKSRGILEVVDGQGSEEEIFGRIQELIFKKFNI